MKPLLIKIIKTFLTNIYEKAWMRKLIKNTETENHENIIYDNLYNIKSSDLQIWL